MSIKIVLKDDTIEVEMEIALKIELVKEMIEDDQISEGNELQLVTISKEDFDIIIAYCDILRTRPEPELKHPMADPHFISKGVHRDFLDFVDLYKP